MERPPSPPDIFPKIDGASYTPKPVKPRPPHVVASELSADLLEPKAFHVVALVGGPYNGAEARVPKSAIAHGVPIPRTHGEPHPPWKPGEPRIIQGDFQVAHYRRSNRRNDEGQIVFEYSA